MIQVNLYFGMQIGIAAESAQKCCHTYYNRHEHGFSAKEIFSDIHGKVIGMCFGIAHKLLHAHEHTHFQTQKTCDKDQNRTPYSLFHILFDELKK